MEKRDLPTPCYLIDEAALRRNGEILKGLQQRTGCRVLLAQKCFSCFGFYPLLSEYLAGTEASGLYEARLGAEEMPGKEVHVFEAAYRPDEFEEITRYAGHILFNSIGQLARFGPAAKAAGCQVGLRLNPECSTQEGHAIYDPCAPGSRLGVRRAEWDAAMTPELLGLLDGLHFHTLCEQDSNALEMTLQAAEEKFGEFFGQMKWLNLGGGHHITRPGYDLPRLERCIRHLADRYGLLVYLEPGEAVALNGGSLLTRVLDVLPRLTGEEPVRLILDASAACHMPDVLEMPYRPPLAGSGQPGEKAVTCRLGGPTCLAGDVIGEYSFDSCPQIGDLLEFEDMAIYTMVKTNTFNGMPLPAIAVRKENGDCQVVRTFGYEDFKSRLG